MADHEALALGTCRDFLKAAELKAICRYRGFSPPGGGKDALAAFVAPRLLAPTGVAEASATLDEVWLVVLHAIVAADTPPHSSELYAIVHPDRRPYGVDYRRFFTEIAANLLGRGVVLVEDPPELLWRRVGRFERLRFHVPEGHRGLLPAFPVATAPLGDGAGSGDLVRFCRQALEAALAAPEQRPDGFIGRVASAVSLDGTLRIGGADAPGVGDLLRAVKRAWTASAASGGPKDAAELRAAARILDCLPPGAGVTPGDLRQAVVRLALKATEDRLQELCEDGHQAGLLLRSGGAARARYASNPSAADGLGAGRLAFASEPDAIVVDLERTGLAPFLEVASCCRVDTARGRLRLIPDIVRLGHAWPRLASVAALAELRSAAPAFERAIGHVESRHGQTLVHEDVAVLRIEDLGLRTLLGHELGAVVRELSGAWLAVPRGFVPDVERLARKEGFAVRRVA